MAIFTHYVTQAVADFSAYLEQSDIQTTSIAIGVTCSLCFSFVWFVVSVIGSIRRKKQQQSETEYAVNGSKKNAVVSSFHCQRKNLRQSQDKYNVTIKKSIWSNRQVERNCAVQCISCGYSKADKHCRYVLCEMCCRRSSSTVCSFHHNHDTPPDLLEGSRKSRPTQIDLSNMKLEECPSRVGYLGAQLVSLNLSNNNIEVLPEEIGFLLGLQQLLLHSNSIETLPDSIRNLSKLQELDISHNILFSLPESIGYLNDLRLLKVNNNQLDILPSSIGCLTHLEYLAAGHNCLCELPVEICNLSKLKVLILDHNNLYTLPSTMGRLVRLEELDVSSCKLIVLPHSITRCSSLLKLHLCHNRLKQLPSQFGHLHQLQELQVHSNCLMYLPASVSSLPLIVLTAFSNPLLKKETEDSICSSQKPSHAILPLSELAAKQLLLANVHWQGYSMPRILYDMLSTCHHCSSCEKPLFEFFESQLNYHVIGNQSLPVYQRVCPASLSTNCKFLSLPEQP